MSEDAVERARAVRAGHDGGDPSAWFEDLYAAADRGDATIPWDRGHAIGPLVRWGEGINGAGRSAIVVGTGYGDDAEHVASWGFDTTAFDVSASAVEGARRRSPGSTVHYRTADLLHLPTEWDGRFDLVVESLTVQSLPRSVRAEATDALRRLVAPSGTLLVIASVQQEPFDGPPWPLTRDEIEAFAVGGLEPVSIEQTDDPLLLWVAELRRAGVR